MNDKLFDLVHAWTYTGCPPAIRKGAGNVFRRHWEKQQLDLRLAMRSAKRFTFNDDFTRAVVHAANVGPEKILNMCHLANLPFDKMWVEYEAMARAQAQFDEGTAPFPGEGWDGRGGMLLERGSSNSPSTFKVTTFGLPAVPGKHMAETPCSAVCYVLDVEGTMPLYASDSPEFDEFGSRDAMHQYEDTIRAAGWGYHLSVRGSDGDRLFDSLLDPNSLGFACTTELHRRAAIIAEPRFFRGLMMLAGDDDAHAARVQTAFHKDILDDRGNLRFIVAMLAMINVCPVEYRHRQPKGYFRHRLRNVPYLSDAEITIVTGRKRIQNVVDHAIKDAIFQRHKKRHEVRGHWALAEYGKGGRACIHEPTERDGAYAMCGKCNHLIVWKEHHERGDASLGYVQHHYTVKT